MSSLNSAYNFQAWLKHKIKNNNIKTNLKTLTNLKTKLSQTRFIKNIYHKLNENSEVNHSTMAVDQKDMQKKTNFLIFLIYYATIVGSVFLTIKFVIPFFMPFLIGFLIAFILKPLTSILSNKTSLSRKICGTAVVILVYIALTFSMWFICSKIVAAIQLFVNNNQGIFENQIMPAIKNLTKQFNQLISNIFPSLNLESTEIFETIADSINKSVAESAKATIVWIAKIGATIPNFLIGLTFAITSSIYISADYANISKNLINLLPKNFKKLVLKTKGYTTSTIVKYFKAYSLIMIISFTTLAIGFVIIGIENPIGIAALTALCDAIPIFGSNLIIVPWVIVLILMHNFDLALKVGIAFLLVSIIRGFLEPKIVGKQIGMHPVLTLIAVYLGLKLFGFIGIILIPIATKIGFFVYEQLKNN